MTLVTESDIPDRMVDLIAENLWERMEQRRQETGKRNRTDQGSGDPRTGAILRKHRGDMSIRSLSNKTGLDHTFIGRIERGERGMSVESLAASSNALGFEFAIDYLSGVYHVNNGTFSGSLYRPEDIASQSSVQAQPRITEVDPGVDGEIIVSGQGPDCFIWVATGEDNTILGHSFVRLSDSQ
jgi:transcriptional regulator with XRE-family HTH domain